MITRNGVPYLDYKESARELGIEESTVNMLVSRGKLASIKFPGNRRKYISQQSLEHYRAGKETGGSLITQAMYASFPAFPDEAPLSIPDLMKLINEGYAHISDANKEASEQIAARYQQTLEPIVHHVINPQERAAIDAISQVFQQMLNNMIVMIKTPGIADAPPATALNLLTQGIDVPPVIRDIMVDAFEKIAKNVDTPPVPA